MVGDRATRVAVENVSGELINVNVRILIFNHLSEMERRGWGKVGDVK